MRRGFQLTRDLVKASFIGTTITNTVIVVLTRAVVLSEMR